MTTTGGNDKDDNDFFIFEGDVISKSDDQIDGLMTAGKYREVHDMFTQILSCQ